MSRARSASVRCRQQSCSLVDGALHLQFRGRAKPYCLEDGAAELEADAKADTEAECDIRQPLKHLETMIITRIRLVAIRIASTYPSISQETLVDKLITYRAQNSTHISQSTRTICLRIIVIMRIHQLWTQIETTKRGLILVRQEELISITNRETKRIIMVLVVAGTDKTGTDLTRLVDIRESTLVRDLSTTREPR